MFKASRVELAIDGHESSMNKKLKLLEDPRANVKVIERSLHESMAELIKLTRVIEHNDKIPLRSIQELFSEFTGAKRKHVRSAVIEYGKMVPGNPDLGSTTIRRELPEVLKRLNFPENVHDRIVEESRTSIQKDKKAKKTDVSYLLGLVPQSIEAQETTPAASMGGARLEEFDPTQKNIVIAVRILEEEVGRKWDAISLGDIKSYKLLGKGVSKDIIDILRRNKTGT